MGRAEGASVVVAVADIAGLLADWRKAARRSRTAPGADPWGAWSSRLERALGRLGSRLSGAGTAYHVLAEELETRRPDLCRAVERALTDRGRAAAMLAGLRARIGWTASPDAAMLEQLQASLQLLARAELSLRDLLQEAYTRDLGVVD